MSHGECGALIRRACCPFFIQNCAFIENEREIPRNNRNAFLEVTFENRVAQTAEALNL